MAEGYLAMRFFERQRQRRDKIAKRRLRVVSNPLDVPVNLFIKDYRLSQPTYLNLCEEVRPLVEPKFRSDRIPLELEVLITLSFLATGSYQQLVGKDRYAAQCQASVSRSISRVVGALNALMDKYIHFPDTPPKRNKIKQRFYEKFDFPGVLGCIDGTQIKILKPSVHEEIYYCRKGFHAINATMICESDMIIIAVCSRFGGSAHDAHVWRSMQLRLYIERIRQIGENFWLLGDSAYPLHDDAFPRSCTRRRG